MSDDLVANIIIGLIGTLGRYALSGYVARRYGERFPTGTLTVNLFGCLLAGFLEIVDSLEKIEQVLPELDQFPMA